MSGWAIAAAVATAAISAGSSIYSSNKQAKAQKSAAKQQAQAQKQALDKETEAFNKQNQKQVDTDSLLEQNTANETGATMLTGASGVSQDQLEGTLGKGTKLLGG